VLPNGKTTNEPIDDNDDDNTTVRTAKLKDLQYVRLLQEQTQLNLSKYTSTAYPTQPYRFVKLIQLLAALNTTVSSNTIENIFFKKTIGNISIERVIIDMYKSNIKF
jgi:nuclear receptor subfamily 2 group E protein 1